MDEGNKQGTLIVLLSFIVIFIIAGFVPYFILFSYYNDNSCLEQMSYVGQFLGGTSGTFFYLAGFLGILMTIILQGRQLKIQREEFKRNENKDRINQFDKKFYELLKIHRDNVSEISIQNRIIGKKAFVSMFYEFRQSYHALKLAYGSYKELFPQPQNLSEADLVNISYLTFYYGYGKNSYLFEDVLMNKIDKNVLNKYFTLIKIIISDFESGKNEPFTASDNKDYSVKYTYKPFAGHMSRLGHYYRHLYHIVSYVVNYDDKIINNKYEYLKIVRTQLSDYEQLLLYYNSLTYFGNGWIINNYFTDYLMIRNLPLPLANFGITPKELLGEKNKKGEYLFELDEILYQDNLFLNKNNISQKE